MASQVRVGLVGTGGISQTAHIPAWRDCEDATVAAVAEPVAANRAAALRALGDPEGHYVDAYEGYEGLLDGADVDLVDVTIPPGDAKVAAVRAALAEGVDVTCQKPFAESLDAAADLVSVAADRDRVLSVNQQARYAGAFARGRERVAAGDLGDLRTAQVRSDFALPGDHHWLHYAVHSFDLLRFWTGREPARVRAIHRPQADDRYLLAAWLDFDGGPLAQVWDEFSSSTTLRWSYRLMGDGGSLRGHEAFTDEMVPAETRYTPAGATGETVRSTSTTYVPDAFAGYFADVCDAVRGEGPVPTPGRDNLRTLRVAFAVREAARGEGWVPL